MCLCETFLLCGFFFFRHDGLAEVRLRCRNATSQSQVDTDIAHRHFGPGECESSKDDETRTCKTTFGGRADETEEGADRAFKRVADRGSRSRRTRGEELSQ